MKEFIRKNFPSLFEFLKKVYVNTSYYKGKKAGFKNIEILEVNTNPSILGMHLARFFDRRFFRILVPLINYFFYKMELRTLRRAREKNIKLSNVMTFKVKGIKKWKKH